MLSLEILLLGCALALDAGIASFALGILNLDISIHHKFRRGLIICTLFGFFQFFMLWLGSHAGYYLSFSEYGYLFQLIVASIFIGLGTKVILESFNSDDRTIVWGLGSLLIIASATSLDALISGVSLGTLPYPHWTATEVGIITFLICSLFYGASFVLKSLPSQWLLRFAAFVFYILGGRVIFQHYL